MARNWNPIIALFLPHDPPRRPPKIALCSRDDYGFFGDRRRRDLAELSKGDRPTSRQRVARRSGPLPVPPLPDRLSIQSCQSARRRDGDGRGGRRLHVHLLAAQPTGFRSRQRGPRRSSWLPSSPGSPPSPISPSGWKFSMNSTSLDDGVRRRARESIVTNGDLRLSDRVGHTGAERRRRAKVESGIKAVALAAAGPKPFVDTVCPLMQQQAAAMSCRRCSSCGSSGRRAGSIRAAVSPKGAQGIAQFMPGTAADRGLDDPFEPKSAIVHSASLLADLRTEFGNVGLAAAAYNAGAERVRAWLDGRLEPAGGDHRLRVVRHRPRRRGMEAAPRPICRTRSKTPAERCGRVCRKLAPLVVRAVYETEPLTASGAWRPWGIQVSTSFSKARALSTWFAQAAAASCLGACRSASPSCCRSGI